MLTHYLALGLIQGASPADAQPQPPAAITSFGSIEGAFATHTKQLQRKLPRHVQRHLLKQLEAELRADAQTRRLVGRLQVQLVQPARRTIDSNASLIRRSALTA